MKQAIYFVGIFLASVILLAGVMPGAALAQAGQPSGGSFEFDNPLNSQNIIELTERVAGWLAIFAIVLAVAMIIITGVMYAFAGGDSEQVRKATRALLWTLAGLAIILAARGIVEIIKNLLGVEFVPREQEQSFLQTVKHLLG